MKKIIIIAVIIIVLVSGIVGALILLRGEEDTWICQNGIWEKHGNPSAPMPMEPCSMNSNPGSVDTESQNQGLIGGQRDEHGCLTPAGYSWCESKQKCLRNWEELCP